MQMVRRQHVGIGDVVLFHEVDIFGIRNRNQNVFPRDAKRLRQQFFDVRHVLDHLEDQH